MVEEICVCKKCGTPHYIPNKDTHLCHIQASKPPCKEPAVYLIQQTSPTGRISAMYLCEKHFKEMEDLFKGKWAIKRLD